MFENEIKFITDFTSNKAKDLGSFFTIEKFLVADIHPSIKKYVEGEIDYLIHQDRKKLIEHSLFDYSGSRIAGYFDQIADEIKKTKKVTFEDIKNIIQQAVSFNANYVVRPKWALSKLIFGNNRSVDYSEVKLMLNYTYYYEYLNGVFLAYMTKKKIMSISVTEFELIMNKIDRELFVLHQSKLVDNALYAIADFYNIGGLNRSSLTIESIESFLKEKNLTELLFKLKRGFPNPARKKIEIEDIRRVLYSAFPIEAPLTEETKKPEEVTNARHFENPIEELSAADEIAGNISHEPEPLSAEGTVGSADLENDIFEEEKEPEMIESEETETAESVPGLEEEKGISLSEPDNAELNDGPDDIIEEEHVEDLKVKDESGDLTERTENEITQDEEEIIIVDDKEEQNPPDFFDDESEISIKEDAEIPQELKIEDDDELEEPVPLSEIKFETVSGPEKEIEFDEGTAAESEKIEFEHETDKEAIWPSGSPDEDKSAQDQELKKSKIPRAEDEDIFSFLSGKEIDRIIRNIFNSDSEDFANTVERMSDCENAEEAIEILNSILKYARIKTHNKDAAALSNAVKKFFKQDS